MIKKIHRSELSNLKMVCGNEKKFTKVIMDGIVKQWVGFGWVDVDEVPNPDTMPTVVEG